MSFSDILIYVWIALSVVLLALFCRDSLLKRFLPLLAYVVIQLATIINEMWAYQQNGTKGRAYFNAYWGGELVNDLALILLVIAMIYQAMEGTESRAKAMRASILAVLIMVGLPFVLYDGAPFPLGGKWTVKWNNSASQVLNFGASLMGLALWGALIANKRRNSQFLTVVLGIGVSVSSAAFTFGVRKLTGTDSFMREVADWAHRILQIISLLIWCWAFWPNKKKAGSQPALQESKPAA